VLEWRTSVSGVVTEQIRLSPIVTSVRLRSGAARWKKTQREDADFRYRIFNADGGEVEQCGNGLRAALAFRAR